MSSADLELLGDLPKLRVPSTTNVAVDQDNGPSSSPGVAAAQDDDVSTPRWEEHRIPPALSCPPAPRKPKRKVPCKRKLVELDFFEIVNREEVDSFFRSSFEAKIAKRSCPCK